MQRICDFIAKWMGVIVLLVAALTLVMPSSLAWIGTWVINPMLGVIMFGMGLTLSANDLKIVLSRPKDIFIGCLTQFTVMPLLAWALTKTFSLPQELAIGVILVGCCPGGTASNVITYLAKGDLALSVGMTAASTLLAPILTPLLVWLLAGTMVDVHTTGMLMSIVYIVILPIVCGLLCVLVPRCGTYCRHRRVTQCRPAYDRRSARRVGGDAPQPARTRHRLSGWSPVAYATPEERSSQHRSGYAELRFGYLVGGDAFCILPLSHYSRRSIQRLA